jgi:hypothetical protein|tara:strand:+ start:874 stop:1050 length:177 start_codon:yes stop_codon:yes gene_type:complete
MIGGFFGLPIIWLFIPALLLLPPPDLDGLDLFEDPPIFEGRDLPLDSPPRDFGGIKSY